MITKNQHVTDQRSNSNHAESSQTTKDQKDAQQTRGGNRGSCVGGGEVGPAGTRAQDQRANCRGAYSTCKNKL